jgi:hypothetical protein
VKEYFPLARLRAKGAAPENLPKQLRNQEPVKTVQWQMIANQGMERA